MIFPFGKRRRPTFHDDWLPLLHDGVILYRTLDEAGQERLRDRAAALLDALHFEGCAGMTVTDEVKVTIAGQAALLLLGLGDYRFDGLRTVLVYPGRFLSERGDELGLPPEVEMHLGEAAHGGPVALSWWHARWGGRRLGAVNVVLHEFAHKFAELGDARAGRPPLVDASLNRRWDRVMTAAREQLAEDSDYGRPTLLDPYGAESPAEFFAVATEVFFGRPAELRRWHADVYELLATCYRQDPGARPVPDDVAASARGAEQEYTRQAIIECTQAVKHRPDFVEAYRERAAHRLDLGDVDGALADWAAVVTHAASAEERAEALYERGNLLLSAGRGGEAVADFTAAIRLCPDYAAAYADRGAAHAELGDDAEALRDLNEALRLDPNDDAALLERAALYQEAGDHRAALADLTRAAKLCPHDPAVFRSRAAVYEALGRSDEARHDRRTAGRLDDDA